MPHLTESSIEQNLVDLLKSQGYEYFYGPDISPYSSTPMRSSFDGVILDTVLTTSIDRLNPHIPESARIEALSKIRRFDSDDLMMNNEVFHQMLTDGVVVEYFTDGQSKGVSVNLVDFVNPENNHFCVVNQFVVKENNNEKRLDVVLFVN